MKATTASAQPLKIPSLVNYGGAIVGGLAGGVLGHQVGGGRGKDAATVVGAVLGAIAGDHLGNRNAPAQYDDGQYASNGRYQPAQREVQRCRTVYDVQTASPATLCPMTTGASSTARS